MLKIKLSVSESPGTLGLKEEKLMMTNKQYYKYLRYNCIDFFKKNKEPLSAEEEKSVGKIFNVVFALIVLMAAINFFLNNWLSITSILFVSLVLFFTLYKIYRHIKVKLLIKKAKKNSLERYIIPKE